MVDSFGSDIGSWFASRTLIELLLVVLVLSVWRASNFIRRQTELVDMHWTTSGIRFQEYIERLDLSIEDRILNLCRELNPETEILHRIYNEINTANKLLEKMHDELLSIRLNK